MSLSFVIIIFISVVAIIIFFLLRNLAKEKKIKAELWEQYQAALQSKNKKTALEVGRRYYAYQRGNGRLTIYDEQAITNDLNAMG